MRAVLCAAVKRGWLNRRAEDCPPNLSVQMPAARSDPWKGRPRRGGDARVQRAELDSGETNASSEGADDAARSAYKTD